MKHRIAADTRAESEAVMYPFVLVISFLLIIGFSAIGFSKYALSGDVSTEDFATTDIPFGMYDMTVIEAADESRNISFSDPIWGTIYGFEVTPDDVLDHVPYPTHDDPFLFSKDWDDRFETKYVHVIMDNRDYNPDSTDIWERFKDFIAVRREKSAGVIGVLSLGTINNAGWHDAAIPFTAIQNRFVNETNVSINSFKLGNSHDTLFVNASNPGATNFTNALWGGNFYIYYGWETFRIEEVDFWAALSMLFVDDIPGVDPLINLIFHCVVIAVVTFVLFVMALRIYEAVVPL